MKDSEAREVYAREVGRDFAVPDVGEREGDEGGGEEGCECVAGGKLAPVAFIQRKVEKTSGPGGRDPPVVEGEDAVEGEGDEIGRAHV